MRGGKRLQRRAPLMLLFPHFTTTVVSCSAYRGEKVSNSKQTSSDGKVFSRFTPNHIVIRNVSTTHSTRRLNLSRVHDEERTTEQRCQFSLMNEKSRAIEISTTQTFVMRNHKSHTVAPRLAALHSPDGCWRIFPARLARRITNTPTRRAS